MSAAPTIQATTKFWSGLSLLLLTRWAYKGEQIFELSVNPPDPQKIPEGELIGVTVLMVTALYRRQEFFRCSYFVYNNYKEHMGNGFSTESEPRIDQIYRSILVDKPRIRMFDIVWEREMQSILQPNIEIKALGFKKKRVKKISKNH